MLGFFPGRPGHASPPDGAGLTWAGTARLTCLGGGCAVPKEANVLEYHTPTNRLRAQKERNRAIFLVQPVACFCYLLSKVNQYPESPRVFIKQRMVFVLLLQKLPADLVYFPRLCQLLKAQLFVLSSCEL